MKNESFPLHYSNRYYFNSQKKHYETDYWYIQRINESLKKVIFRYRKDLDKYLHDNFGLTRSGKHYKYNNILLNIDKDWNTLTPLTSISTAKTNGIILEEINNKIRYPDSFRQVEKTLDKYNVKQKGKTYYLYDFPFTLVQLTPNENPENDDSMYYYFKEFQLIPDSHGNDFYNWSKKFGSLIS